MIRANFCRYVGRLWVGTRRSVVNPFSDVTALLLLPAAISSLPVILDQLSRIVLEEVVEIQAVIYWPIIFALQVFAIPGLPAVVLLVAFSLENIPSVILATTAVLNAPIAHDCFMIFEMQSETK